jgi:signal transduction histidine kinase
MHGDKMRGIFLRFNIAILILILIINFVISPLLDRFACRYLNKQINEYSVGLLKGPYFVTMKYLESVPENEIQDTIKNLQNEFGFQINAVNLKTLEFPLKEMNLLKNGEILPREEGSMFYKRIGHTNWAIEMGPIKEFDEVFSLWQFQLIAWITIIFSIAVLSLIWAFPFWQNLKKVMDAADHFGAGRFDARAELGKRSQLRQLAETFNNMAERIEDLIRSQKLLVNAVSHELRTPISRARFGIDMLENTLDEKERKRYSSGISEDIDDLESLVSELLTYASFDQKTEFIHFETINIKDWLKEIVSKLSAFTKEKKLKLDLENAPETLSADSRLLGRALENLILNAIKYADSEIVIKAEKKNRKIMIIVSDDGPGIPEKFLVKVFEPFVRLDESRNRDTGGHGLGLAIVKQIVEKHGGSVFAEKKGVGCSIKILLPYADK